VFLETSFGFIAANDFEKLLLLRGAQQIRI
jgi:hypothetical protein